MGKDKILHFIVGILMALFLSLFNVLGLFLGWGIIIGWEVWQWLAGTGTPEVMDIVFGIIPFTVVWCIMYFSNKKWQLVNEGSFSSMVRSYMRSKSKL